MDRVAREIESLHEFFVAWFSGAMAEDEFDAHFQHRFDDQTLLIQPGGEVATKAQFGEALRGAWNSNPEFRIQIRNVQILRTFPGLILASYEEWQVNALASRPPDNGRLSSVLFADNPDGLVWLHIHETWLPEDVMTAGPYDF